MGFCLNFKQRRRNSSAKLEGYNFAPLEIFSIRDQIIKMYALQSILLLSLAAATEAQIRYRRRRRIGGGAIAGIVVGVIVLLIITMLVLWLRRRRMQKRMRGAGAGAPVTSSHNPAGQEAYAPPSYPPP